MQTTISRSTSRLVSLAQNALVGEPAPPYDRGGEGYVDWVIVTIHGLQEHIGHPYRQLLNVLTVMPDVVATLGLDMVEFPDSTTICSRKQELKMRIWRTLLRLSSELHDLGDVQAIHATGVDRHTVSQHYATRTNYTF